MLLITNLACTVGHCDSELDYQPLRRRQLADLNDSDLLFFGNFQLPTWRQLTQDLEGDGSHSTVHTCESKEVLSVAAPLSAATVGIFLADWPRPVPAVLFFQFTAPVRCCDEISRALASASAAPK